MYKLVCGVCCGRSFELVCGLENTGGLFMELVCGGSLGIVGGVSLGIVGGVSVELSLELVCGGSSNLACGTCGVELVCGVCGLTYSTNLIRGFHAPSSVIRVPMFV